MPEVSKETFKGYSTDSKLDTLFDYQKEIHGILAARIEKCDLKFKNLENGQRNWKIKMGTAAAGSGFLGGFVATLLKLKFWG